MSRRDPEETREQRRRRRIRAGRIGGLLKELKDELFSDHNQTAAAALAFNGLFGLLPALAAATAIWGLVADPAALRFYAEEDAALVLPEAAADMLVEFVSAVPQGFGLGTALAVNLIVALWASQRAASGLLTALNIVYDERERRTAWQRELVALGIAIAGMGFLVAALGLVALPPLLATWWDTPLLRLLSWARWPALVLLFVFGLGLLFTYGPSRAKPCREFLSWGALAATLLWLAASYGLSVYMSYAGTWGRLYGSFTAAVVVLFWLYLSALAVLTGAEINAMLTERREGQGPAPLKRALRRREKAPSP